LLSLLSEIRPNVFPALPDGIIVYLIITWSCSTTFDLWNMISKNRGILAKFGRSTFTLNTLYLVLYISNISKWKTTRPKKRRI
jgi:hypothetical protein